jgi:hypothetical protein
MHQKRSERWNIDPSCRCSSWGMTYNPFCVKGWRHATRRKQDGGRNKTNDSSSEESWHMAMTITIFFFDSIKNAAGKRNQNYIFILWYVFLQKTLVEYVSDNENPRCHLPLFLHIVLFARTPLHRHFFLCLIIFMCCFRKNDKEHSFSFSFIICPLECIESQLLACSWYTLDLHIHWFHLLSHFLLYIHHLKEELIEYYTKKHYGKIKQIWSY